jgi:hypothetical protein
MKSSIKRPPDISATNGAEGVNDGTALVCHKTRPVIETNRKTNENAIMIISCIL